MRQMNLIILSHQWLRLLVFAVTRIPDCYPSLPPLFALLHVLGPQGQGSLAVAAVVILELSLLLTET